MKPPAIDSKFTQSVKGDRVEWTPARKWRWGIYVEHFAKEGIFVRAVVHKHNYLGPEMALVKVKGQPTLRRVSLWDLDRVEEKSNGKKTR